MKEKLTYEEVTVVIERLRTEDIITTSGGAFEGKDEQIARWYN